MDMDALLEQQALAAAVDQVEDAAAQNAQNPGADVEAAVQSTPDDVVVLEARSALERGDYTTVLTLFHSLEDQGRTFAETMLGGLYLNAAEQGNAVAQSILGFIYGTACSPPHYDEALIIKWWHSAANQGEPHAQHHLGQAYGNGYGVPVDYVQAFKYLTLA